MKNIKVAIVGVGNCCSSLIQGIRYYQMESRDSIGLLHRDIGEQRLRDLLECSSDVVWETDANGVVNLFVGQHANEFEVLGRRGRTLHEPDEAGVNMVTMIDRRLPFRNMLVTIRARSGEQRVLRTSGKPTFDSAGNFLGFRGAGTDVTDSQRQKQIDEEQRKAEALGRLASGMAHEINNLLQPVIIYAALYPILPFTSYRSGFFIALFIFGVGVLPTHIRNFNQFKLPTVTATFDLFWNLLTLLLVIGSITYLYHY